MCATSVEHHAAAAAGQVSQSSAYAKRHRATATAGQISQSRAVGVTIVDLVGVVFVYAYKLSSPNRGIFLGQGQESPMEIRQEER